MATIIEVLAKATQQDLADLDVQIDVTERHLASLVAARKLIHITLNGKAKRASPRAADGGENGNGKSHGKQDKRLIGHYLLSKGPTRLPAMVVELEGKTSEGRIRKTLTTCAWFVETDRGWELTPDGRNELS